MERVSEYPTCDCTHYFPYTSLSNTPRLGEAAVCGSLSYSGEVACVELPCSSLPFLCSHNECIPAAQSQVQSQARASVCFAFAELFAL